MTDRAWFERRLLELLARASRVYIRIENEGPTARRQEQIAERWRTARLNLDRITTMAEDGLQILREMELVGVDGIDPEHVAQTREIFDMIDRELVELERGGGFKVARPGRAARAVRRRR